MGVPNIQFCPKKSLLFHLLIPVININDPYSMQILFFEVYFLFIEKLGNYLYILITYMHMYYDNATAAHNNYMLWVDYDML